LLQSSVVRTRHRLVRHVHGDALAARVQKVPLANPPEGCGLCHFSTFLSSSPFDAYPNERLINMQQQRLARDRCSRDDVRRYQH
jgi:hypothetical protein